MASLLSCSVSILPRGAASFNRKNTIKQRNVVHKKASIVVTSKLSEDKTKVALGQKAVAALAAAMLFVSPPAFAADKVALQAKGRVFAEASAAVLRAAPANDLKGALSAATEVALSVNPGKAIFAVDAALEALQTASLSDLAAVVKAAEQATTAAIDAGLLIPPNNSIDDVVDAAAAAAGGVNADALSKFSKAATEAALSADGKKIGNLTFAGGKLGLSVGPSKIAAATAAAVDLISAL
mmetsp:Transcript_19187/g.31059  ORF Transcript_19187/g.31059 Transcript_19187/m.31059 type:complete len:239 (+) Transcript_19187:151-867(+)